MFPWELVLGLVQQLLVQHTNAAETARVAAQTHTQAVKDLSDVHTDVKALHESHVDVPTTTRLEEENATLKRVVALMMKARQMFPDVPPRS